MHISQPQQNAQKFNTAPSQQIFQADSKCQEEPKSSGRKELPADLFTASYLSGVAQAQGWHSVPLHGMDTACNINLLKWVTHGTTCR